METPPPLPVVLSLTALIDGLLEAVAARYGIFPIRGPVLLFLWKRFSRVKQRFASIAARLAAGKAFPARSTRPRASRAPRANNTFRITRWLHPKFGWLCRFVPGALGAPGFACQLRDLLTTDPDMRTLLAATPATARALRPLCWMLGVPQPTPTVVLSAAPCVALPEPTHEYDAPPPGPIVPRTILAPASVPPRAAPPPPDPPVAFSRAA